MDIKEPFVLPEDVLVTPVAELPDDVLARFTWEPGDHVVTRPRARSGSRVVDSGAAELLREFREPATIVEAVLRYCRATDRNPKRVLEEAYPVLRRLLESRLLIPTESGGARHIDRSLLRADEVDGYRVVRLVQLLEDSEVLQATSAEGTPVALKMLRAPTSRHSRSLIEREARILGILDGCVAPRLLEAGVWEDRPYLALEWCRGSHLSRVAEGVRRTPGPHARARLLSLCARVAEAYANVHARGVLHGDVHPKNVLVSADGRVRIVDYGYARSPADRKRPPPRGGIGFYFEPEYAAAELAKSAECAASDAGEQYGVAALLYECLTGASYRSFSLERESMMRQIAEEPPLPFEQHGVEPWPGVESVLSRALMKDPSDRYPGVSDLSRALEAVADAGPTAPTGTNRRTPALQASNELLDRVLIRLTSMEEERPASPPSTVPRCSVTYGDAGVAFALRRMAIARDDPSLLAAADEWLSRAHRTLGEPGAIFVPEWNLTPDVVGNVTPYHTSSGVYCVAALQAISVGDVRSLRRAVTSFTAASQSGDERTELTLGRSGTVLGTSCLLEASRHVIGDLEPGLRSLASGSLRDIWGELDAFGPIGEDEHTGYLGVAHGWAGTLFATLRWLRASGDAAPGAVETRLRELAERAEPTGRGVAWPVSLGGQPRPVQDHMAGWCHGTAGYVHLWTLAHEVYQDERFLDLARGAAWHEWEVRNDRVAQICCGLGGRAYALLNLYKHTAELEWLQRARVLAERAASLDVTHEIPNSLYKGDVGIALLAAELARPERACMPFFESEGWPAAN